MRAGILLLAILLGTTSVADAMRLADPPEPRYSPSVDPLPLRGNIFIDPIAVYPRIRWVKGFGETTFKRVGTFTRIDYVVNDGSVADIDGILYTFSLASSARHPVRSVALHRADGECATIDITLDDTVAAMKARLTRGERVEDYWLVSATKAFELDPTCDPSDATIASGTLEVFVTLADGREKPIGQPIPVARIPLRSGYEHTTETLVDPRVVVAFSLLMLMALAGALARPRVALHGLVARNYLPKLRFRIRLPRAKVYKG